MEGLQAAYEGWANLLEGTTKFGCPIHPRVHRENHIPDFNQSLAVSAPDASSLTPTPE